MARFVPKIILNYKQDLHIQFKHNTTDEIMLLSHVLDDL